MNRHETAKIRFALAFLGCWGSHDLAALQTAATSTSIETSGGLKRAVFRTPQGTINVNLPDDMATGDTLSGTVIAEPTGNSAQEKDANLATLSGYVFEAEHQKTSVRDKIAVFTVPAAETSVRLVLRDPTGREVSRTEIPVAPSTTPTPSQPLTDEDFQLPTRGKPGASVRATGPFSGDLRKTNMLISGRATDVLAESPRQAIFRVPPEVTGLAQIEMMEGDLTVKGELRSLQVRLTATQIHLIRGQTAVMTLTVSGLKAITEPVDVTLMNASPGVVAVAGGQLQTFQIRPEEVSADGVYTTQRTLTGVTGGGFNVSAFVPDQPIDKVNLRATASRAMAQWQTANNIRITPEAQSAIISSVSEARPELRRLLLAQNEQSKPEWLTTALIRHYCFNLRDVERGLQIARRGNPPLSFQLFQAATGLEVVEISVELARAHTFVEFMRHLISSLSASTHVGQLDISSNPVAARITIDSKVFGYTFASFVVSAGRHSVAIATPNRPCRRDVQVIEDQTAAVSCP